MDLWSVRPEGGELKDHFEMWRERGFNSRYVPGYWGRQSEHTVLAQNLETPGSAQTSHAPYADGVGWDVVLQVWRQASDEAAAPVFASAPGLAPPGFASEPGLSAELLPPVASAAGRLGVIASSS